MEYLDGGCLSRQVVKYYMAAKTTSTVASSSARSYPGILEKLSRTASALAMDKSVEELDCFYPSKCTPTKKRIVACRRNHNRRVRSASRCRSDRFPIFTMVDL